MITKECFAYLEDKIFPGQGNGWCLQCNIPIKGDVMAESCENVLNRGGCPRKHKSPYLKQGERS